MTTKAELIATIISEYPIFAFCIFLTPSLVVIIVAKMNRVAQRELHKSNLKQQEKFHKQNIEQQDKLHKQDIKNQESLAENVILKRAESDRSSELSSLKLQSELESTKIAWQSYYKAYSQTRKLYRTIEEDWKSVSIDQIPELISNWEIVRKLAAEHISEARTRARCNQPFLPEQGLAEDMMASMKVCADMVRKVKGIISNLRKAKSLDSFQNTFGTKCSDSLARLQSDKNDISIKCTKAFESIYEAS